MPRQRPLLPLMLLMAFAMPNAQAAGHRSHFGFRFELDDDWVVLSPDDAGHAFSRESLASLGVGRGDPATMQAILDRVQGGEVEFYLDRRSADADFTDNISVQAGSDNVPSCLAMPAGLAKTFGEPVRIARCGSATLDEHRFAVIEYTVPSRGMTVLQYAIPWTPGHRLVIVGGWTVHGAERVRAAQDLIAKAILRGVQAPAPASAASPAASR